MKKLSSIWQHLRWDHGTISVAVQDGGGMVLTLAWLNRESLMKSITSGTTNFFSRTCSSLRMKGSSSKHFQYIEALSFDCDYDAALLRANTFAPACHNYERTCFHNFLRSEMPTIVDHTTRCLTARRGSYANSIICGGMERAVVKVHEEMVELSWAVKGLEHASIIKETSDLCFHLLILLLMLNIDPAAIVIELKTRSLASGSFEKISRRWEG